MRLTLGEYSTEGGLLYKKGSDKYIPTTEADEVAYKYGFQYAEQLVAHIARNGQSDSKIKLGDLKYEGGGYFRDKNVPRGTKARCIHAPKLVYQILKSCPDIEIEVSDDSNNV